MKTLALLVLMLILFGSEARAQNGAIMFSQHGAPSVGEAPYGVVAGDFDDDGDLDLASANRNSNERFHRVIGRNNPSSVALLVWC